MGLEIKVWGQDCGLVGKLLTIPSMYEALSSVSSKTQTPQQMQYL